jgi:hypothetical protein
MQSPKGSDMTTADQTLSGEQTAGASGLPQLPPMDPRLSALRWLLNITTEYDRKDVRTRQAARLLDDYNVDGWTNRELLEDLWRALAAHPPAPSSDWQIEPAMPSPDVQDDAGLLTYYSREALAEYRQAWLDAAPASQEAGDLSWDARVAATAPAPQELGVTDTELDARRYRWLRNPRTPTALSTWLGSHDALDAAIDAALSPADGGPK